MNPIFINKTPCLSKLPPLRVAALTAGACAIIFASVATSCSTTKGFGKDVEKTGEKIQNAASR